MLDIEETTAYKNFTGGHGKQGKRESMALDSC